MTAISPMKWLPEDGCLVAPTLGSHRYVIRHTDNGFWSLECAMCPGTRTKQLGSLEEAIVEARLDLQTAIDKLIA